MARKEAVKSSPKKAMSNLEQIAKAFGTWRPTTEVFAKIRSVPTVFPQFDHATGVGGVPIGRIIVVTGPSNQGKTLMCLGFVKSYLQAGNPAMYGDAEHTMDDEYFKLAVGDCLDTPLFQALRPQNYEEMVEATREFAEKMEDFRKRDIVPRNGGSLIITDSIKKLVPKNLLKNMLKGDAGIDGASGRGAQMKAALNAQWCDELVPLLDRTNTTMVFVARESEDPNATVWDKKAGEDFKIGGGKAIIYDSSLVIRVERDSYVETPYDKETKTRGVLYGERHKGSIRKTKLGSKRDRIPKFFFHSSNGVATPAGLDTARDLLEIGERFGVVDRPKGSSWYSFEKNKWQGEHAAVSAIAADPAIQAALDAAVRARFGKQESLMEDQEPEPTF